MRAYLPILLLLGVVLGMAGSFIALASLLVKPQRNAIKQQAYESGIAPLGDARERFSVKFYMVAMLFIVFDIETVFLVPWGASFRRLSCLVALGADGCPAGQASFFGLGEMLVFMATLVVGLVYVWRKGALQWD